MAMTDVQESKWEYSRPLKTYAHAWTLSLLSRSVCHSESGGCSFLVRETAKATDAGCGWRGEEGGTGASEALGHPCPPACGLDDNEERLSEGPQEGEHRPA